MRPQERKNLIKAGIFTTVLLGIFMVFIITLGSENSIFEKTIHIKTKAKNAENLKLGAMVQLKGLKVGSIEEIKFLKVNELELTMRVAAEHQPWIKTDAMVAVKTAGVLGDKFLEIVGGTDESACIQDEGYIEMEKSLDMKDLMLKGGNLVTSSEQVMQKLNEVLINIDQGKALGETLRNLEVASKQISKMLSGVDGKKLSSSIEQLDSLTKELTSVGANVNQITKRIQNGPGTLHSLIYDDSAYEDLRVLLGGAQRNQVLKFFIRESIKKAEEANKAK
jgi:phospholipid/cholesterol/gamma-HCH transport system substrate-binding protein